MTGGSERWLWVDPCCTFLFAVGVVYVTKQLVVDIVSDLMERSPDDVAVEPLVAELEALPGVLGVHDLHVWSIGSGKNILTAHVDAAGAPWPCGFYLCACLPGVLRSCAEAAMRALRW